MIKPWVYYSYVFPFKKNFKLIQIKRPDNQKFIKIFEDSGLEVHTIDVRSTDVTFPEPESEGRTLIFKVDFQFTAGQKYYILIDGGILL